MIPYLAAQYVEIEMSLPIGRNDGAGGNSQKKFTQQLS